MPILAYLYTVKGLFGGSRTGGLARFAISAHARSRCFVNFFGAGWVTSKMGTTGEWGSPTPQFPFKVKHIPQ